MAEKIPPPAPGTHTPGWNDPPNLQYNPLPAGKTKLNLNKRIAFPLQGGPAGTSKPTAIVQPNQSTSAPLPMTMPPLVGAVNTQHPVAVVHPMPNVNAPPPTQPPISSTAVATATTTLPHQSSPLIADEPLPDDVQDYSLGILRLQLNKVQDTPNVRLEEVQRRVGVIEQLWQSGNLSEPVQRHVYKIAKAVETNSLAEAMETYTTLVLNNSNECSTWAVALRHIILTLQPNNTRSQLPTVTDDCPATTSVSPLANCVFVPAMPRISNPTDTNSTRINPVQHI